MLSKLLKYDLRANLKIYLFVWPAIIALALIDRLSLTVHIGGSLGTIFTITTTTLFVLALFAACILALVISIIRFYSGLLRNEGYLMFTLPVKSWQLILSKFLTALLTLAVTIVLSIFCAVFVFGGVDGLLEVLSSLLSASSVPTGITLALTLLICGVSLCLSILQIYLACSIGHLFRRRRILFSILFYYAISIAVEFFTLVLTVGIIGTGVIDNLFWSGGENLFFAVVLAAEVALGCVYFFVSERLLRRHLNLE